MLPDQSIRNLVIFMALILCCTIWESPDFLFAQASQTAPALHTVAEGETLSEIAARYGLTEAELMELNGMGTPDFIFVGQKLRLPNAKRPAGGSAATHRVRAGETLSEIAKAYGVSQQSIMQLNGVDDANQIYIGQSLLLPDSVSAQNSVSEPSFSRQSSTGADVAGEAPDFRAESGPLLPLISYTVKRGETLSEIAKGLGFSTQALMEVNGIDDPDEIFSGQALSIPPAGQLANPSPSEASAAAAATSEIATSSVVNFDPAASSGRPDSFTPAELSSSAAARNRRQAHLSMTLNQLYTVRSSDTPDRIAWRTGVDLESLLSINGLTRSNAHSLRPGQRLVLPARRQDLRAHPEAADAEASKASESEALTYEISPGDNLSTIAKKHGLATVHLMRANDITNPDAILVGQRLLIPATPTPSPPEENESSRETAGEIKDQSQNIALQSARRGNYYYTVHGGDTLSQIASNFGTTPMALIEYNDLPDTDTVYQGLELRIPFGPPPVPLRLPPSPDSGTRFLVSISRQECWLLRGAYVAHAWRCSTGYGEWTTRLGTFHVKTKIEMAKSSAYELDMPYWLGIYDVGQFENGIHGLPVRWQTGEKIWSHLIGEPATFGCAMLDDRDAEVLFASSYIGMPVHIVE